MVPLQIGELFYKDGIRSGRCSCSCNFTFAAFHYLHIKLFQSPEGATLRLMPAITGKRIISAVQEFLAVRNLCPRLDVKSLGRRVAIKAGFDFYRCHFNYLFYIFKRTGWLLSDPFFPMQRCLQQPEAEVKSKISCWYIFFCRVVNNMKQHIKSNSMKLAKTLFKSERKWFWENAEWSNL